LDPPTRYSKSAFDYLDTSVKELMIGVSRAIEAITITDSRVMVPMNSSDAEGGLVSVGNTSIRACCFRWAGGGICPTPRQGLLGFLADSVATTWGPYEIQAFETITLMMQMAQLELLLPAGKKHAKRDSELPPLVMYYTLDGSTPSADSGRRITQGELEEAGGAALYMEKLVFSHTDYGGQPLLAPVDITINAISSRQPPFEGNASLTEAVISETGGSEVDMGMEGAVTNITKEPEQTW
jgi:hypothetical protein